MTYLVFRRWQQIKDGLVDEPGLRELWDNVIDEDLEDNFCNDVAFHFRLVLLWRHANAKDNIDDLAIIVRVHGSVREHGHMWLKVCKERWQRQRPSCSIGGCDLCLSGSVIPDMLCENHRHVVEHECVGVDVLDTCIDDADDVDDDAGYVRDKVLVVAGNAGPPGRHVGA